MPTAFPLTTRSYPQAVNFSGCRRFASAISPAAEFIRSEVSDLRNYAERSQVLFGRKAAAISEIQSLAKDCSEADWDGYGARPIDPDAIKNAVAFIRALPDSVPLPEFAIESDGAISLDWIHTRTQQFAISVSSRDRLAFAWIDGTDKGHGVARFDGERIPTKILKFIGDTAGDLNYAVAAVGAA